MRVTGGLSLAQLVTLVSADAVLGHARAAGRTVEWIAGVLTGDLASQLAVERELAREGLDRAALGRDDFVDRARAIEEADRIAATEMLGRLGIDLDLASGALDADAVAVAARTAFVRLYEAGLLTRGERVVNTCPRCATVVDDVDAAAGTATADAYTVRLPLATGATLDVEVTAVELLGGAVAVAVPPGNVPLDAVEIPTTGRAVPVITDEDRAEAAFVTPAHDGADLELARRHGLAPIMVLDGAGTVVEPGPLEGQGRYAARATAIDLLAAEGAIGTARTVEESVLRCRRCGTVLVPRLGRHWFLPMADLEVLAADAVRQDVVSVLPPPWSDELVAAAGQRGDWCLSHQVWAGQPVPVATCLDCGQAAVSVEPAGSCGKCMGTLVPDDDVLDARFVGAVWPLALAGWPADEDGPALLAPTTVLLVAPTGLVLWAVRMAALGLRLCGAAPFACVTVHPAVDPFMYLEGVPEGGGPDDTAVHDALVTAGLDLDWAAATAAAILAR